MENDSNFEVFLFFSPEKILLSVNRKTDFKLIFKDEFFFEGKPNHLNFDRLNLFLNENVFKVEKILGTFVEKINVILETKDFLNLQISVKQNDYNENINSDIILYLIKSAKYQCEKTIQNMKIIHILIDRYLIDDVHFTKLPLNQKCKNFSLDISFICLPDELIKDIEKTLKNFQISVSRILSGSYIDKFSNDRDTNFFKMTSKIISGYNKNEVNLVNKTPKNEGFFEKFFNLFN
tara:strand:+ start:1376 stop:2080 length:705 start_codon:yes stop_codon:yes gene_type:complete